MKALWRGGSEIRPCDVVWMGEKVFQAKGGGPAEVEVGKYRGFSVNSEQPGVARGCSFDEES